MALSKRARKRIVLLLITVVVGSAAIAAGLQWRRAQTAQRLAEAREQGLRLHEEGKWEQALVELNRATYGSRDDAELLVAIADSRRRVPLESGRHVGSAVSFAQQALVIDPQNAEAMDILLTLYPITGQVTELIDVAERRLAIDPEHHDALWARAQGLIVLGRSGEIEAVDALVEEYPDDVRGHALRIQQMLSMGAGADAVRAYADVEATKRPNSAEFLLLQAEARVRTSGPNDTLDELRLSDERAASLEISDPASLARVVQLLDLVGQSDVADDLLERELDADSSGEALAVAVERDWKSGRIEQARERAQAGAADLESADPALLGWAVLLAESDAPQGAEHPAYGALRLRDGSDARFWQHLIDGREALESGDWGAARTSLNTAIQSPVARSGGLAPLDIAEYLLGRAELALGAWREAGTRWERVASRNPSWTNVRLELAALALENGLNRESFDHAGRILATQPGNYAAGKAAARAMVAMLEAGEVDQEASDETVALMQELRRAIAEGEPGERAQILALEARTRLIRGELDLAQRAVDQIAALGASPPVRDLLPLLDRGEQAGLASLDRIAPSSGEGLDPRTGAALASREASRLVALGRADEARKVFTDAIGGAAEAGKGEYERAYAIWLEEQGDDEGLTMLRARGEENPRSAQAQIDLLNAASAWTSPEIPAPAIAALREIGGESSIAWRIYEARTMLTFEPTEARAAKAVELLGPGLRATSPDAAALALAGEAMVALGDPAAAADYFGRALDADPRRTALYPRLIAMLLGDGRLDMARARQSEFVRLTGLDLTLLRRRAELSEALGMWESAIDDRRTIAERAGSTLIERARWGSALARGGRVEEADRVFGSLRARAIDDVAALALVADFLNARGRAEEALDVVDNAEVAPAARARIAAALLVKQGREGEARERLEAAAEEHPGVELYADLARLLLKEGDAEGAVAAIDAGLELDPDSSDLAALSASARMRTGDTAISDALAQLADASVQGQMAPGMTDIIEATRRVTEDQDIAGYITRLEDIASRTPASLLLSRLLANAHMQVGDVEKAISVASNAARVFASDPEAARLAADILAQGGRLTEATAMAERWVEQTSGRLGEQYDARRALGELLLAQDEAERAVAALAPVEDRIIEDATRAPDRFDLYARALAGAGRANEARSLFDGRLGDGDAVWFRLFTRAGVALHRTPDEARAWLEEAESVARTHPELMLQAGQAWFDLAGITGETDDFERVIALLESMEGVERSLGVLLLAVSLEQVGRLDEAESRLRQAVAAFPQEPVALNNLAYLLVRRGTASDEAAGFAATAVSVARERGYPAQQVAGFLHTRASVLSALGRDGEAVGVLREALEVAPRHPQSLLELSELLYERGEVAAAVRMFGSINPDLDAISADAEFRERYESLKTTLSRADP